MTLMEWLALGVALVAAAGMLAFLWARRGPHYVAAYLLTLVILFVGQALLRGMGASLPRPPVPAAGVLIVGLVLLANGVWLRLSRGTGWPAMLVGLSGLTAISLGVVRLVRPV